MGNPSATYHQANVAALTERGIDPYGDDDTVLGEFVYCHQHCRSHATGWCTVSLAEKTPLDATTPEAALAEAREKGFWIYGDPRPCTNCGTPVDLNKRATDGSGNYCPPAPGKKRSTRLHTAN